MKKEKETKTEADTKPEETTETVEKTEEVSQEEILSQKVEALEKEIADLKDRDLRRQADVENFKKRLVREKEDAVLFANSRLISDLLEFMDNLERTISAAKSGGDAVSICQGVELIQSQLLGALGKNWGLEKIESTGKEFDPQEHEACMMEVDPSLV